MDWPTTFNMQLDEIKELAQFTAAGAPFLHGKTLKNNQFAMFYDAEKTKPCFTTKEAEKSGAKVAVGVYDGSAGPLLGTVRLTGRTWRLASTWKIFDAANQAVVTIQQDVGLLEFWIRFIFSTTTRHYRVLNTVGQLQGRAQQMWVRANVPGLQFNCPETLRTLADTRLVYAAALLIAEYDVETLTFF